MCKWNLKNVIYLSILGGRHHPVSCSDLLWGYTLKSSYWCIILMFVCLPSILPDPKQHTDILLSIFRLVSSEHPQPASYCTVHTGTVKVVGSAHCPLQTGRGSLVANIKLSLGFMYLLPNKFILDQTDLPAYAQDKMFKWCKVGLSKYDPECLFFPYPLTCNLKINTQAPPGCDNFSKQNGK